MPALGGVVGTVLLTVRGRRVGWEEKTAGCLVWLPAVLIGAEPFCPQACASKADTSDR